MRTAEICPTCATYFNAACIIYDGIYLANIDVSPLDDLPLILSNINSAIPPRTGIGAPSTSATYIGQYYINTSNNVIYYAISTGNGAADWRPISLQTVTDGGNTTTNTIKSATNKWEINTSGAAYFSSEKIVLTSTGDSTIYNTFGAGITVGTNNVNSNSNKITQLGDVEGTNNSTSITINDDLQTQLFSASNGYQFDGGDVDFLTSTIGSISNGTWNITGDGEAFFANDNFHIQTNGSFSANGGTFHVYHDTSGDLNEFLKWDDVGTIGNLDNSTTWQITSDGLATFSLGIKTQDAENALILSPTWILGSSAFETLTELDYSLTVSVNGQLYKIPAIQI